ncbi:glycosyltransferase [Geodermatophilus sp. SYSU D00766]
MHVEERLVDERQSEDLTDLREPAPGYVCFSAQDWWYHNRAHSDFQLMRRVARTRRVLLVNSIGLRMPLPGRSTQVLRRIGRKAASTAKLLRRPLRDTPEFHVMTPVVLPFYRNSLLRRVNAWSVRAQVRLAMRLLRMPPAPVIVCTIPTAWDVVRPLERRALVYNRSDRHSDFPESDQRTVGALENALLHHADRVLYVSRALMTEEDRLTGDRARFLDHGVDIDHFTPDAGPEPADLAGIPHPRIGFFGGLDDYLVDFDLLERVAVEFPEASLVLVGDANRSTEQLTRHPNVHRLGYRPYEQVPTYGAGFDVALMPWLDNEWIARCNPIKLKEYLALGLAVVSTDFPEVRGYADRIRIAADQDEFISLVRHSLEDGGLGDPVSRRASVAAASWDARADDLVRLAEQQEGSA